MIPMMWLLKTWYIWLLSNVYSIQLVLFILTIFDDGAYLTFKSIFHKALNLF